jgi:5-enolpyruvylshikimate-3-phosphate synthase
MSLNESPFVTYHSILVDGDYSAAGFLQAFAMAMYAGAAFPMDASGLRNLDDQHMRAFQEMAAWFRSHGEVDPDFVEVCKKIKEKRAAYARRIKSHLDEILATDPDQYEGGRDEHRSAVRFYQDEVEKNKAKRWID